MSVATINTDDFVNCKQAAKALKLSPESVRVYCNNAKSGKTPALHGMNFGREWLIPKTEIERYKRERSDPGRPSDE